MIFDKANEALKNWKSLLPMLRPLIKNETKNAVRRKKMNVATAPNGTTIGVTDPADTTVINIPYQPACANVSVGQSVWVEWLYDNFSTAIAVTPGDGLIPSPLPVSQGGTGMTLNYKALTSAPTDRNVSYDFTVTSQFTAGGETFPLYSKGRFVAVGYDAVMWAVDSSNVFHVAFRNASTWVSNYGTLRNPKVRSVTGSIENASGSWLTVCSTTLPAGYTYMIFGHVWTNDGSSVQVLASIEGASITAGTRTNTGSGQGVMTYAHQNVSSSNTTIYLRTYGYTSGTRTYSGRLLVYQFPGMETF